MGVNVHKMLNLVESPRREVNPYPALRKEYPVSIDLRFEGLASLRSLHLQMPDRFLAFAGGLAQGVDDLTEHCMQVEGGEVR